MIAVVPSGINFACNYLIFDNLPRIGARDNLGVQSFTLVANKHSCNPRSRADFKLNLRFPMRR